MTPQQQDELETAIAIVTAQMIEQAERALAEADR